MEQHENPAIVRARELVLAHGWNATSYQIINPGIARWFSTAGDAVVGYVRSSKMRVVAGAPVCEKVRLGEVVNEFESDARNAGESVCYFGAESRLDEEVSDSPGHARFLIGAQSVWDPAHWAGIVAGHSSLRAQVNRARNKGVEVTEWPVTRADQNPALEDCLNSWLDTKGLPPLHFMIEPDTLARLENRRIFAAELAGGVVGFLVLSPIATRNGWLFEQFPHRQGAPNGTVELMIDTAMRRLAEDGCHYATLGLSPLSTRADIGPVDDPIWLRVMLAWVRKHGQRFYNFDGLDAFKAKLHPDTWEPVFAVSNEPRISYHTLWAIASAFSGNAPIRMLMGGFARAIATEFRWLRQRLFN